MVPKSPISCAGFPASRTNRFAPSWSTLRTFLEQHQVAAVYELGWGELQNGDLLKRAEESGYHLIVTTDQNLRYQQNLPR
jgi:hypothetical protein